MALLCFYHISFVKNDDLQLHIFTLFEAVKYLVFSRQFCAHSLHNRINLHTHRLSL